MSKLYPEELVVKTGTYLYDGTVECDLRIVRSTVRYGSGDIADSAYIGNEQWQEAFYVHYGSTTERGQFDACSGAFSTIDAAFAAVEKLPGIGSSARWYP